MLAVFALSVACAVPAQHVILVTIDGVRWQDATAENMPVLSARVASNGVMWRGVNALTSSLAPVSLPGYQTLMVGRSMCIDNACSRVTEETLPERVARELALPPAQVAVFASWSKLARAASAKDGTIVVDAPPDGPPHSDRARGETGPPWSNARWDHETAAKALAHLEQHQPRFLYVSLLDVDEHAHARDHAAMLQSLREADRTLARIFTWVDALPADERAHTTVIVTTDHGRGPGPFWFDHRSAFPTSREIFMAIVGARSTVTSVSQADVRPTIEALLGLTPTTKHGGRVLVTR
jgi:predicted AlkP superfamily pyrophosphatase or phosphodiesterase